MNKKQGLIYVAAIVFSVIYIIIGNKIATANPVDYVKVSHGTPYKAKVIKVIDEKYHDKIYEGVDAGERIILFTAVFTNGYQKGSEFDAVQRIDKMYAIEQRVVKEGDNIIVYKNPDERMAVRYMFAEFFRVNFLVFLIVAFCVIIVLFGRMKGVNTLVSLGFTIAAIFYVFIPSVLNGHNIYVWAISVCVFIIFMTLIIISGFTKKSIAAIIGCFSGVGIAGILTVVADKFVHLTGLVSDDSMNLLFLNSSNPIDLKAVVFAAISIGSIGAIMDVSMSISAALAELKEQVGYMSAGQITASGLVIGRDILGTMANTLILAYIGSSLSVTLLLAAYNSNSMLLLFNSEMIITEILQAIAGSFGILLTIPLTSVICGFLYADKKEE